MSRPIRAIIHSSALRHNLALARAAAPRSRVMAVIKANGYGHGLLRAAQGLSDADGFAVLGLEEGVILREAGFRQPILLLEGLFGADELPFAARHGLTPVVHNRRQLEMLENAAMSAPLEVFLKLNSGMNRLGFTPQDYADAYGRLRNCAAVSQVTLMTHFATADENEGVAAQLGVFEAAIAGLEAPRTLANSAALLRYPQTHYDWVRPGIMLYGATPVAGTPASHYGLQPALTLSSEIITVQNLSPGQSVGYGHRFTADKPMRVGIVACGYADGYPRHAPNTTPIAVADKVTRIIGRVSMDMLYADITELPEAGIGSPVELWGAQVPVDAVAEASGTVGYELLCAIAQRVPVMEAPSA